MRTTEPKTGAIEVEASAPPSGPPSAQPAAPKGEPSGAARFSRNRSRRWAFARAVACCALELAILRFAWLSARAAPGQWALTYFGRCPGGPGLVQGRSVTEANPPIDVDREGRLGAAPGQSLSLPLTSDVAYTARGTVNGAPPYLVLLADTGGGGRGEPPAPKELPSNAACASGALAPAVVGGALRWQAWRADAPWSDDVARLKAIALQCDAGGSLIDARVRREAGMITLDIGRCSLTHSVVEGAIPGVAVVAGPLTAQVDRDGGWSVVRRVEPVIFAASGLVGAAHAAILIVGFGGAPALVMLATLAAAGALSSLVPLGSAGLALFPLLVLWFLLAAFAGPTGLWRRARSLPPSRFRIAAVLAAYLAVAAAFLLGLTRVPALARAALGGAPIRSEAQAPAPCLLTGYSTAGGIDITPRGADALAELRAACGACGGSVARHAMPGRIFEDVRSYLDAGDPPGLAPGGTVLFWGGGNDDVFWPMLSPHRLGSSLVLSAYFIEVILRSLSSGSLVHPTALDVRRALERSSDVSASFADEQDASVRAAVAAVVRRGGRFVYANDFLAYDMDGGRSPKRSALVARRRAAVEAEGGVFVDMLEELGSEAGAAWFNDFIHPSAFGHAKMAPSLCRAIERAKQRSGERRTEDR